MSEHCILYATNERYLLPTLVSACQIREYVHRDTADVIIFLEGAATETEISARQVVAGSNISIIAATPPEAKERAPQFVRHFAHEFISPHYKKLLYVDSDTQIMGDVNQLLNFSLPSGKILASPDPMTLRVCESGRQWRRLRQYFMSIGVPSRHIEAYINSGVFLINRSDFGDLSKECLALCSKPGTRLEYLEQDAMNIAFSRDIILMSMRWNFPAFLMGARVDEVIGSPHIYHFMSNPRPWQGPFFPWGQEFYTPYSRLLQAHPTMASYSTRVNGLRCVKYRAQQYAKRLIERKAWSSPSVLGRSEALEAAAAV